MRIEIPGEPVSVNEAYATVRGRRVKTRKAREYDNRPILWFGQRPLFTKQSRLSVDLYVNKKWLTKSGAIRKNDVANYEKIVIDKIANRCGFDDSQIFKLTLHKIESKIPCVVVEINEIHE